MDWRKQFELVREERGMPLAECARRAHIPYPTLQRWLYAKQAKPGEKEPRLSDAIALAHALQTTVDALFLGPSPRREQIIRRILKCRRNRNVERPARKKK